MQKKFFDAGQLKKKIIDALARRNYTELELRKKFSAYTEPEVLTKCLEWIHELKLIPSDSVFQDSVLRRARQKKQGIHRVNQKLSRVGVAPLTASSETEFDYAYECALKRIEKKEFADFFNQPYEDQKKLTAKVCQHLQRQGFDMSVITSAARKALKTKFKKEDNL